MREQTFIAQNTNKTAIALLGEDFHPRLPLVPLRKSLRLANLSRATISHSLHLLHEDARCA